MFRGPSSADSAPESCRCARARFSREALNDDRCRRLIVELGRTSRSCICSRLSPMQKLQIVQLVRSADPKPPGRSAARELLQDARRGRSEPRRGRRGPCVPGPVGRSGGIAQQARAPEWPCASAFLGLGPVASPAEEPGPALPRATRVATTVSLGLPVPPPVGRTPDPYPDSTDPRPDLSPGDVARAICGRPTRISTEAPEALWGFIGHMVDRPTSRLRPHGDRVQRCRPPAEHFERAGPGRASPGGLECRAGSSRSAPAPPSSA